MTAQWLEGKDLARRLRARIKQDVSQLAAAAGQPPRICAVLIGQDEGAQGYARAQKRTCHRVGMEYELCQLSAESTADQVIQILADLNADPAVTGLILLTPLPPHLADAHLNWHLDPRKDIDGSHPTNLGRLTANAGTFFVPATPAAGLALLADLGVDLTGQQAVVIGRSDIVGKPLALSLLHRHCTVTLAHSRTRNLAQLAAGADILCVATGQPRMISSDYVKPGAVVLDFGTTYEARGVTGDCDADSVSQVAGWLTPVPGGIGPLTNTMLMQNTLTAWRQAHVSPPS